MSSQLWRLEVMRQCVGLDIEWLIPSRIKDESEMPIKFMADEMKIRRADIIFAYIGPNRETAFSGTSWEMGGGHFLNKKVILVNRHDSKRNYDLVNYAANQCYQTLEDGIEHLRELVIELGYKPKEE